MTSPRSDDVLELAGGRRLAYAEYGSAEGRPVILFHGLPGSRLSWGYPPREPIPQGLRVIAPDRPGYGLSDPNPGRSLLDWADDMVQLADALKIARLAIVGVSGGGPGALAWLIRRDPARYINTMKLKVHEVDRKILALPEIQEMLARDFAEALRSGGQGMVDDMAANLYLANAVVLITHEIDSASWRESELFNLPGGIRLFPIPHIAQIAKILRPVLKLLFRKIVECSTADYFEQIGCSEKPTAAICAPWETLVGAWLPNTCRRSTFHSAAAAR
jgi:hypothetical protein